MAESVPDNSDYDILLQERGLARKSLALIDERRRNELETLFLPRFCIIGMRPEEGFRGPKDLLIKYGGHDSISSKKELQVFRAIRAHDPRLKEFSSVDIMSLPGQVDENLNKLIEIAIFSGNVEFFHHLFYGPGINEKKRVEWASQILNKEFTSSTVEIPLEIFKTLLEFASKSSESILKLESIPDFFGLVFLNAATNGHTEIVKFLLSQSEGLSRITHGKDLSEVKKRWVEQALPPAAKNGHIGVVKCLLENGLEIFDLGYVGYIGCKALCKALENEHEEVALLLIDNGAHYESRDYGLYGETPLEIASQEGFLKIVRILIAEGADISRNKALQNAAQYGHVQIVKELIDAGMSILCVGGDALEKAAYRGNLEVVEVLVREAEHLGQALDIVSAINKAIDMGRFKVVKFLVEHCDKKSLFHNDYLWEISKVRNVQSPILYAASRGRVEIFEFLLNTMCEQDIENAQDFLFYSLVYFGTSWHEKDFRKIADLIVAQKDFDINFAPRGARSVISSSIEFNARVGNIKILIDDYEAKISQESMHSIILNAIIIKEDYDLVEFLVSRSEGDISELSPSIILPLIKESYFDGGNSLDSDGYRSDEEREEGVPFRIKIAELLIDSGFDIDKYDPASDNKTLLIMALERKDHEFAKFLINKGVNVNLCNSKGDSPLAILREVKFGWRWEEEVSYKELENLLVQKGAIEATGIVVSSNSNAAISRNPIAQPPRDPTKLSVAINTGDNATGNNGIFKMQQVGESLNGPAIYGIRTAIKESHKSDLGEFRLKKCETDYSQMQEVENFQEYCKEKIDRLQYAAKDQEKEGSYYLFEHKTSPTHSTYGTRMFSMHCQDHLEAISADSGANILAMHKDKDGFIHVTTDKECKLSYVLHVLPLQEIRTVAVTEVFKKIADQYAKNVENSPGEKAFPKKEDCASGEDWLDKVFQSGTGSCTDRVLAFDWQLQKSGIDPSQYRVIQINANHVALEVRDEKEDIWRYIDLGGRDSRLVDVNDEKEELYTPPSSAPKPPSPLEVAEEESSADSPKAPEEKDPLPPKEQEDPTKSIKEYLESSLEYKNIEDLSSLRKGFEGKTSLLVTKNASQVANILINQVMQDGRGVFCIDSPRKIDIFKQVIAIDSQDRPDIWASGFLAQFLTHHSGKSAKPPLLIIDWDVFTESQKVALNTILDKDATIQGISLQDVQLVSLTSKEPKDSSFLSRHESLYRAFYSLESDLRESEKESLIPIISDEDVQDGVQEVDFEGFTNWQQKLFGSISIKGNQTIWKPSNFVKLLQNGRKDFLVKNLSSKARQEMTKAFARAKAQGYFDYQGKRLFIPSDIKFGFSQKDFDFAKFHDSEHIKIHLDRSLKEVPIGSSIINTQIFDKLLHDKIVKDGIYSQVDGLIARASTKEGKALNLFITSKLTTAKYYFLLNQAQKYGVSLNLFLSPNIKLPDDIKKELSGCITQDKFKRAARRRALPRAPGAKIIATNDPNRHLQENPKYIENAIILDIEDYSYQDLVESLSFEIKDQKFQNFQLRQSPLISRLSQGQKIVLKGNFSPELLQMMQPLLIKSYASNLTLIIENQDLENDRSALDVWSWFGADKIDVHCYPPQRVEKSGALEDPDPVRVLTSNPARNAQEFISKRLSALDGLLTKSNLVRLVGESGVGKSSLLHEYDKNPNVTLYCELSSLASWANDKIPGKQKLLFIDEANIEDFNFTMFAPMLKGGNPTIFYQGEFFELTKDHKVVFAGNDLSYGGGRNEQKLFTDYEIPTLKLKDFSADYIYQKLLKEEIFDKIVEKLAEYGVSHESLEAMGKDFLIKCSELIDQYQQVNEHQRESETVRELQEYALRFMAKMISTREERDRYEGLVESRDFVSVDATKTIERALNDCFLVKSMQRDGDLPTKAGLSGVFLEGGSGTGKSSLIKAMLEKYEQKYHKIDASMPKAQKEKIIIDAFENGETVWIDELNSCIEDGLEKTLNAVLTGTHPKTQKPAKNPGFTMIASANKSSMEGRGIISPALRHRMYCPRVSEIDEYTQDDISKIISHWSKSAKIEIDRREVDAISSDYLELLKSQKDLNLRDLEQAFTRYAKENCVAKNPEPVISGLEGSQLTHKGPSQLSPVAL